MSKGARYLEYTNMYRLHIMYVSGGTQSKGARYLEYTNMYRLHIMYVSSGTQCQKEQDI